MVKLKYYFLLFFIFASSVVFAQTNDFPTMESTARIAKEVSENIKALESNITTTNIRNLEESLQMFKKLIADANQAVDREKSGAVTPKAREAVRAVGQFGVDISNALFAFRTEQDEKIKDSGYEQKIEDLMVNELEFPLLQMSFSVMRHKVDEKSNVDGRVSAMDVFRRTFSEVGRDIVNFVSGGKNRTTGEMFYTPVEAVRRERLSRELISLFELHSLNKVPVYNSLYDNNLNYNRENHEERLGGLLLWLTDRAVNIRVERDSAQKYARFFWLASGFVLSQPIFNIAGDAYTAHLETSMITATAFALIYALKTATSSIKSTEAWLAFNKQIRKEMAEGLVKSTEIHLKKSFPNEYHPAQVPHWLQRKLTIRAAVRSKIVEPVSKFVSSVKNSCNGILGRTNKG